MRARERWSAAVEQRRSLAADAEALGELLQLGGGCLRRLDVADRERNLHLGGEPPRARQRVLGVVSERPVQRGRGFRSLALGEPQQSLTRLRVSPELMRLPIRLLGRVEVAAPPPDLADLVVAGGRRERVVGLEIGARVDGLALGLVPLAAKPEDLGAVHAAGFPGSRASSPRRTSGSRPRSSDGHGRSRRPLGAGDRHAVDDRRRERIELTGKRRGRCLVEQRETGVQLSKEDEAPAVNDESQRLEVGVAKALADVECTLRVSDRLVELAHDLPRLDRSHERRPSVLE